MTPCARMESASSLSPSSAKFLRGCWVLGRIRSISISRSGSISGSGVPNRALRPRPKAFRCAMNNLLCEAYIGLCSFGFNVVKQDRTTVAGSFPEPNVAWNDRGQDFFGKKLLQILHHLIGKVGSFVKHR